MTASTLPSTLILMDPIDRAKIATDRIEQARQDMAQYRTERQQAINDARATMSAVEIAEQLGISRARVYAIAAGKD